jgi:LytS/YehU family sensor histidine kinase
MRSVLNNSSHETITLQEEIDSLKIYLALEHSRFEDKFDFEINVDPNLDLQGISVPPMLVQPYIENAIWHGLRYKEDKGFLSLSFSDSGNEIDVKVEDNGIGREASQKLKTIHQRDYKSTGIENTKERIRLLNSIYKTDLSVAIEDLTTNEVAVGTKVVLKLPKRLES